MDSLVDIVGHLLQRQLVVDALDGALDGWRDEPSSPLDRAHEEVDVSLPAVDVRIDIVSCNLIYM